MVSVEDLQLYYRHTSPYRASINTDLLPDADFEVGDVELLEQKRCIGKKCPFYKNLQLDRDLVPRNSPEYQRWIRRSLGIVCQGLADLANEGETDITYHESAGTPQQSFFLEQAKCQPASTRPTNE